MKKQGPRLKKYIETGVNVSLILVCLTFVGVLAKTYLLPAKDGPKPIAKGDTITFTSSPGENRAKTLLLFLQSGCEFCSNSAPFYRELIRETASLPDVKIAAVFSTNDENYAGYTRDLGLEGIEIRRADFVDAGIAGTPTIALVGEKNTVSESWRGYLSIGKRVEVRRRLGLPAKDDFLIDGAGLDAIKQNIKDRTTLDVRNREEFSMGHAPGAKNIPLDELSIRAVNEIPANSAIVLTGSSGGDAETAYDILVKEGFSRIYILKPE